MISQWIRFLFDGICVTDPTSGFRVYSSAALKVLAPAMPHKYPEPASIGLIARSGLRIGEIGMVMRSSTEAFTLLLMVRIRRDLRQ